MGPAHHGLDDDAVDDRVRPFLLDAHGHLAEGGTHRLAAGQAQLDTAHVGLVRDVGRVDLHDHREAQLLSHEHGLGGVAGDQGLGHGNAEGGQQGLGFHLVQQVAAFRQGALDDQAGAFHVGLGALGQGAGGLHQLALVVIEGGQVGEHLHRRLRGGEVGNAGLLETAPAIRHLGLAHPAGDHRLAAALRHVDDRIRGLGGAGHGLGGQHDQDTVHVGIVQAGIDGMVIAVGGGVPDDVHGVAVGPGGGQDFVQPRHGLGPQFRQLHVQVHGAVGGHDAGAAAVGDDGQAVAGGFDVGGQGLGAGEELQDGVHPHHAGPAHQGVEHRVGAHQGAGVGLHRLGAGLVAAHLDQHHRLEAGGGAQGAHEAARVADALDVEQDALGGGVVGQVVEDLAEIQVRRGAGGNHAGEADAVGFRPVQHGGAQGAGLGHQGQVAGEGGTLAEGGVEADGGPLDAQAIGADEADVVLARHGHDGFLQGDALGAHLPEAGRQDDGMADAARAAILEHLGHGGRGRGDQGQLGGFRQFAGIAVAVLAVDHVMLGIDREHHAGEAGFAHVLEQGAGDGVLLFADAEHGDGTGIEQGVEVML